MKLTKILVENFKAVESVEIVLTPASLIVGSNNCGKSSILQAIHFASRAIAQAGAANKQSTISLNELEYIPSADYRELGNSGNWGNVAGTPESRVEFHFIDVAGAVAKAEVILKSARNEGVSVDPRMDQALIPILRSKEEPFTAYIPGIAGIPLQEQWISKRNVFRKVASGDSNVVLRNIFLLLERSKKISQFIEYINGVYDNIDIDVKFNEERDYYINCRVGKNGLPDSYKPLEYSGTGLLQVAQIFSYLILFKPKIILIDEPESHLHPTLQTKLIREIQRRVTELGAVALVTTHSPYVARGLTGNSSSIWISKGRVAASGDSQVIRDALGWGALDKKIILCTEDNNTSYLQRIISQVPALDDAVSIFPFDGVSKMGTKPLLIQMRQSLGNHHHIIVHRDRDFMTDDEADLWSKDYIDPHITPWITEGSDLEMYFCDPGYVSVVTGTTIEQCNCYINDILNKSQKDFLATFENKRREINTRIYAKMGGSPSTATLWAIPSILNRVRGKDLLAGIRSCLQAEGINGGQIGKTNPSVVVALDLFRIISKI